MSIGRPRTSLPPEFAAEFKALVTDGLALFSLSWGEIRKRVLKQREVDLSLAAFRMMRKTRRNPSLQRACFVLDAIEESVMPEDSLKSDAARAWRTRYAKFKTSVRVDAYRRGVPIDDVVRAILDRPARRNFNNPHAAVASEIVNQLRRERALTKSGATTARRIVQRHLEEWSGDFDAQRQEEIHASNQRFELLLDEAAKSANVSRDDVLEGYTRRLATLADSMNGNNHEHL